MMKNNSEKTKGALLELLATFLWGSCFVVTKSATDIIPPCLLQACRMFIAVATIAIVFRKKLKLITKELFLKSCIIGVFYCGGLVLQTLGIKYTSAGRSAFVTSAYCIFVPFIELMLFKKKPEMKDIIAGLVCMLGIGFIVLNDGIKVDSGDLMTLGGSICFAIEIVIFGRMVRQYDETMVSMLMMLNAGITALILSLFTETMPAHITVGAAAAVVYLAIPCTVVTVLCQANAQKILSSAAVTIILGFEAVFAAIISAIVYGESFTGKILIGCILVFLSSFVAVFDFKKSKAA